MSLKIFSTSWLTKLKSLFGITKTQTKLLLANFTGVGEVVDLTFNNLIIGKYYQATYQIHFNANSNFANGIWSGAFQGANGLLKEWAHGHYTTNQGVTSTVTFVLKFTAVTSQLIFTVGTSRLDNIENVNAFLVANSTHDTKATLEELPNHKEVTEFT